MGHSPCSPFPESRPWADKEAPGKQEDRRSSPPRPTAGAGLISSGIGRKLLPPTPPDLVEPTSWALSCHWPARDPDGVPVTVGVSPASTAEVYTSCAWLGMLYNMSCDRQQRENPHRQQRENPPTASEFAALARAVRRSALFRAPVLRSSVSGTALPGMRRPRRRTGSCQAGLRNGQLLAHAILRFGLTESLSRCHPLRSVALCFWFSLFSLSLSPSLSSSAVNSARPPSKTTGQLGTPNAQIQAFEGREIPAKFARPRSGLFPEPLLQLPNPIGLAGMAR